MLYYVIAKYRGLYMKEDNTTISIQKSNRDRLEKFKIHKRETLDDLLSRLLDEVLNLRSKQNA